MNRRDLLSLALATAAASAASAAPVSAPAARCETDGTPAQFTPKAAPDPRPEENDLAKFPRCPYCGMDRKAFHHSRMLIRYSSNVPDAVCSLHCAAISLSINVDAEPAAIWVADNATDAGPRPLVDAQKASFLVGGSAPGVMSARSKVAYGSGVAAKAAQAAQGGEVADFDQALAAAYGDMARDVARIRKMREERRSRAKAGKE